MLTIRYRASVVVIAIDLGVRCASVYANYALDVTIGMEQPNRARCVIVQGRVVNQTAVHRASRLDPFAENESPVEHAGIHPLDEILVLFSEVRVVIECEML